MTQIDHFSSVGIHSHFSLSFCSHSELHFYGTHSTNNRPTFRNSFGCSRSSVIGKRCTFETKSIRSGSTGFRLLSNAILGGDQALQQIYTSKRMLVDRCSSSFAREIRVFFSAEIPFTGKRSTFRKIFSVAAKFRLRAISLLGYRLK